MFSTILALSHLGRLQELDGQLYRAAETYRRVLQLAGDQPGPSANDACLGLARICYEWNDLNAAQEYTQQSRQLARLFDRGLDRFIISEVFLARLQLARGDVAGSAALLAEAEQSARQQNFLLRMPEIAAAQVLVLLRQGNLAEAARLPRKHKLPLCQARVLLAQSDPAAALATLATYRQQAEVKGWTDERLRAMILQALAHQAQGDREAAVHTLAEALALAEPGGFIRTFVDEGQPMAQLVAAAAARGIMPDYSAKLLAAFAAQQSKHRDNTAAAAGQSLWVRW